MRSTRKEVNVAVLLPIQKLYSLFKSVNVTTVWYFPLNKLYKKINLIATATYDYRQKNSSDIYFCWLGNIITQKDMTYDTIIVLRRPQLDWTTKGKYSCQQSRTQKQVSCSCVSLALLKQVKPLQNCRNESFKLL